MTTKVVILCGQSNASGQGANASLPASVTVPVTGVEIYADGTIDAGHAGAWMTVDTGFGCDATLYGPEVGLAAQLKAMDPATTWRIIKYTKTATSLHTDWAPGGAEYVAMSAHITAALAALGGTPEIVGFVWVQGESDADTAAHAASYRLNMIKFAAAVRAALGLPRLPFVSLLLSPTAAYNFPSHLRSAQRGAALIGSGLSVVESSDLAFNGDGVHYNAASQATIGRRCADALAPFARKVGSSIVRPSSRSVLRLTSVDSKVTGAANPLTGDTAFTLAIRGKFAASQPSAAHPRIYQFGTVDATAGHYSRVYFTTATKVLNLYGPGATCTTMDGTPYLGFPFDLVLTHAAGNNVTNLWLNGAYIGCGAANTSDFTADPFIFGTQGGSSGCLMDLYNARFDSRAWTEDEIHVYGLGLQPATGSMARHWGFDDGAGATTHEDVGGTDDAITTGTWVTAYVP